MKAFLVIAAIGGVRVKVPVIARTWADAIQSAGRALGATRPFYAFVRRQA